MLAINVGYTILHRNVQSVFNTVQISKNRFTQEHAKKYSDNLPDAILDTKHEASASFTLSAKESRLIFRRLPILHSRCGVRFFTLIIHTSSPLGNILMFKRSLWDV